MYSTTMTIIEDSLADVYFYASTLITSVGIILINTLIRFYFHTSSGFDVIGYPIASCWVKLLLHMLCSIHYIVLLYELLQELFPWIPPLRLQAPYFAPLHHSNCLYKARWHVSSSQCFPHLACIIKFSILQHRFCHIHHATFGNCHLRGKRV